MPKKGSKYESNIPRHMTATMRLQIMRTEKTIARKQAYLDKLRAALELIDKINKGESEK